MDPRHNGEKAWLALRKLLQPFQGQAFQLRVRTFHTLLPSWPRDAEGLRLLHLTDLHAGAIMPRAYLRSVVAECVRLQPDMVVITGDFVSRRSSYLPPFLRGFARPVTDYAVELAQDLAPLKAPLGVYCVPGNHDSHDRSFASIEDCLAPAGMVSLVNRGIQMPGGWSLAGLDDLRAGNPQVRRAFADLSASTPQVVLSHNPRMAWMLGGRNALILSGHTHGGQILVPWAGITKTPVDTGSNPWLRGTYHLDRAALYVSSGVGTIAVPVRVGVPPEVALFTLRRGDGPRVQLLETQDGAGRGES